MMSEDFEFELEMRKELINSATDIVVASFKEYRNEVYVEDVAAGEALEAAVNYLKFEYGNVLKKGNP